MSKIIIDLVLNTFVHSAINPILYNAMSVKFRRAFGRTLSCGKNSGDSAYGRWAYGRGTHTTYTCASTALPSTSTFTYNAVNRNSTSTRTPTANSRLNKHGSRHRSSSSTNSSGVNSTKIPTQSIPLRQISPSTGIPVYASVDLTPDSTDAIQCYQVDLEMDQLVDPDEVTHL